MKGCAARLRTGSVDGVNRSGQMDHLTLRARARFPRSQRRTNPSRRFETGSIPATSTALTCGNAGHTTMKAVICLAAGGGPSAFGLDSGWSGQ